VMIPIKKLTRKKLILSMKKIIEDPFYRQNAQRLKEALFRAGGAERAADLIQQKFF